MAAERLPISAEAAFSDFFVGNEGRVTAVRINCLHMSPEQTYPPFNQQRCSAAGVLALVTPQNC
jgi:hypothetical protein